MLKHLVASLLVLLAGAVAQAQPLTLKKGDRISIVGNTLAERMQHHGWLETYLYTRFPQHDLVFRNLGFSGDEVTTRLRSANFGSPDEWLTRTKTDVVFAFFGYNESFKGKDGLDKFKSDLDAYVKNLKNKKYNGTSPPRVVLFSPITHEDPQDKNLPDGKENNERLKLYTDAIGDVAKANEVVFVDLFTRTAKAYAESKKFSVSKQTFTINGIHLNELGDRMIGHNIDIALFGVPRPTPGGIDKRIAKQARIRAAVLERNFHWFNRYRTVDGYSIFGGRAGLKFNEYDPKTGKPIPGKINTNFEVAQREMEILDVMTANRDKACWAAAQGKDYKVDDSNTPGFVEINTNKPGPLPGLKHKFLGGDEAISKMKLGKNLKVNLFASEEKFPDLANPVQMAWDNKGRLWVACMPSYPHWKPKEEMNDKIIILEDTKGTGVADKCTVWADKLHVPTGLEFWNGGLLVGQQPDLMFLKDTDGKGRANYRERILHGIDSADTHHALNSFVIDGGGALYFQEGTFHHTQVETPWGPPVRNANAGVYRFEPRTFKFETFVNYRFANPHGHVFDRWGQNFVTDGTGNANFFAAAFSGKLDYPSSHSGMQTFFKQLSRPCPGNEILSSRHFPPEYQGNFLNANVITFQGIYRFLMKEKDSGFTAEHAKVDGQNDYVVVSTDPNFRPSDVKTGPDGAIYFSDWHNPIIGHMQHNLRDPNRNRTYGRVYRITYDGRALTKAPKIDGATIPELLEALKASEDRVRYRARLELSSRKTEDVVAATAEWLGKLDKKDADFEHHQLEGLWLHQNHNVANRDLLKKVLASPDHRARAAAARVLCYQRDQISDSLEIFKELANDKHPRVRLEAVRAASFFTNPDAVEVVLIAAEHPTDYYLDYTMKETRRQIDPFWKAALAKGQTIPVASEAGTRFFLRNISNEALLKAKKSKDVYNEILLRHGLQDNVRREAVGALAKLDNKAEMRVLLDAIARIDSQKEARDENVIFDLVRMLTSRGTTELAQARAELEKLATSAKQPVIRQIGYVSLMNVDGSPDKAWALATKSVAGLRDFLAAMPMISDASTKASLYSKIEPLLEKLPDQLAAKSPGGKGYVGRYVRIELPGDFRTLTLAEVEVYSDGTNVARQGKATQSSTAHNGAASRAIDGNKNGSYTSGGQTHTKEGETNPWWQVDLGKEFPIESNVIYNRTAGSLGSRLNNYTLRILDANKKAVYAIDKQPAPMVKADHVFGRVDPAALVRRDAMTALTTVRGQETKTFGTLSKFIFDNNDRLAAIRAMQRIPRKFWPKGDDADKLIDTMLKHIRAIPTKERTTPDALDALEFADALTTLLAPDRARKLRAELGELGVRVIRIGTLPERMAFDKEVIVVEKGKAVEFIFENIDLMPHNIVFAKPGSMEELGKIAEASATSPEFQARYFVPKSDKVLLASTLLQPRELQKLSWTAPTQPGVYPYVCTYPGHWMRMHGALYVVDSLEEYLANPDAYLAKHPLKIEDPLLKDRRPRTEWKYVDLASDVEKLGEPGGASPRRNYNNGKAMFKVASCIACHKMDGEGNDFGPDLLKLDMKLKAIDILKDIVEPSFRINEKYQTWVIETKDGKVRTGIILDETPQQIKFIENPLVKAEPIVILKAMIAEKTKSPTSVMPKGLLDTLTRDEILDLIAYITARGNRQHPLFRPDDHPGGHGH
ncbi:MAG: HEAT repeat domain-containing protein [Planctomycetes bacterium]|nr:HEAT repeat domain-containing protein [Planctomycetota bacterium]